MKNIIHKLSESVANQIAAGEVVQRPSSIIKELLENSIDASSKNIKVIIEEGGKSKIIVIDDGLGMTRDDAIKCFEKHSTSKLKKSDDLFKIKTMGFRGEALSSISSVCQVELSTQIEKNDVGNKVVIEGSKIKETSEISKKRGTTIIVKNIFYNVPARRSFLKSDAVELKHIIDEFQKIAIANTNVNFSLYNNEIEIYKLKKSNLSNRIVSLFGKNYKEQLIKCDEKFDDVSISGFIGKPKNSKKTRGEQFLFVNNRYIKSSYLNHSIIKSYGGLIEEKRFPFYILFIDINPKSIDINVHPTKNEIKFEDEKLIYSLVHSSVNKSLAIHNVSPSINFEADINFKSIRVKEYDTINKDSGSEGFTKNRWDEIFEEAKSENMISKQESFFEDKEDQKDQTNNEPIQLVKPYIFKQLNNKVLIFNQSLMHERILYEKYKSNFENKKSNSQQSLFPKYVELNKTDFQLMSEMIDEIKLLGFDIDIFGDNSIIINGIPSGSEEIDEKNLIESFIEEMKLNNEKINENKNEKIIRSFAKRCRISEEKKLEESEMKSLIDQLFSCEISNYTPDGEKIFIQINKEQINNLFNV